MAGWVTLGIALLGMLVEITPVKINPVSWLGKTLHKDINARLDEIERKTDMNDIDTIRNRIIANEALLRKGETFTEKQWENLYKDITKWESYHETYKNLNGFLKVVIENIDEYYHKQTMGK